ncbi:hypothetical protein LEMLEM_LOCUS7709 [Lemmus lemmus]
MMKLWFSAWPMLNYSNPHRTIPSFTLYIRHTNSILISHHICRDGAVVFFICLFLRKRNLYILYLSVPPRRTRNLLWLLQYSRNLKHRNCTPIRRYSNSIYRLRPPMRTDILLRSYSYYKSLISHPLHRYNLSRMNLRWIFSR